MGIPSYSVVKGDPAGMGSISGKNPHYRFNLNVADGTSVQVDVNVQSTDGSDIRYLIVNNFTPPDPVGLQNLPLGRTALDTGDSDLRIDYILEKKIDGTPMVDPSQMQDLDLNDTSMQDAVADLLNQALNDPNGLIYAFGSYFADSDGVVGVHDIHMNQGNPPGPFANDNGSWQDGAIFIQLPGQATTAGEWTALFIAFQTQTFTPSSMSTAT
jgi:uncharacterized protein YukJ